MKDHVQNVNISRRGRDVQGSPIRKLAYIAEARKKTGVKVYHLNIGQPDLPSPMVVRDYIRNFSRETIEYAPSNGLPQALNAWKNYLSHYDIQFDESEMIVTTGGSEAIVFALCSTCDVGDEVLVFEPFYTNYNGFASIANINLHPITLKISNKFNLPPKEEIENHIHRRTKAILFCNPSNPTGKIFTRDEFGTLIELARKHGLFLISDEVYREFAYESRTYSVAHFPEIADRAILVDSCSKRFNVCGARIGLIASKNKDVIYSSLKFGMARLSVATLEQLAMVPMLHDPGTYVKPIVEEFRIRRDVVFEGLQAISGITSYRPEGAFYIVIGLPVKDSEHFAKWLIEEFEDKNETVLLAPAQGFYVTPGLGSNEVRLAFMLNIQDLKRSLQILDSALTLYRRKY